MRHARTVASLVVAFIAIQILLYVSFMKREVTWSYNLYGDPTWYIFYAYETFKEILHHDWAPLWEQFRVRTPWGFFLFVEAAAMQFIFGPGRIAIAILNLIYYLVAQLAVFRYFQVKSISTIVAGFSLALFMAMHSPFRLSGAALNISDFHFDFVLFCLMVIVYLAVGWSDCFSKRGASIIVGALAAFTVCSRLVSFFLFGGVFGTFFLWLLYQAKFSKQRAESRARIKNFLWAAGVYCVIAVGPIRFARHILFIHYFNFLFNKEWAQKIQLYRFGANKWDEFQRLMDLVFNHDFGKRYWIVFAIIVLVLAFLRSLGRRTQQRGSSGQRPFLVFLAIATVISIAEHLAFPVKSDHLTRMTAAPIFILCCLVIQRLVTDIGPVKERFARRILAGTLALCALLAGWNQLAYYCSPGRYAAARLDGIQVQALYTEMSRFVHENALEGPGLSVDGIDGFELGSLLSFLTFEFENYGVALRVNGQLGAKNDEPITLEDAKRQVERSDIVLTSPVSRYPHAEGFPFIKTLQPIHREVLDHIESKFCYARTFTINGLERRLYLRDNTIHVRASAPRSEGLWGVTFPWIVPITPSEPQWVEYTFKYPTRVRRLIVAPQFNEPHRAPRRLTFQGLDHSGTWTDLKSVRDVSYAGVYDRQWEISTTQEFSTYRLLMFENDGAPDYLSIREFRLDVDKKCDPVRTRS
jgi:hypothetical protein